MVGVETRETSVERTFADFDDAWEITTLVPSLAPTIAAMEPSKVEVLKQRLAARLTPHADGTVTCSASANAVKGRVPG